MRCIACLEYHELFTDCEPAIEMLMQGFSHTEEVRSVLFVIQSCRMLYFLPKVDTCCNYIIFQEYPRHQKLQIYTFRTERNL